MAIPLVPEEIKPSLESGHIDAVEWTTSTGIIDLGLMEVSRLRDCTRYLAAFRFSRFFD